MKKSKSSLYRFYSVMLLISIGIAASAQDQLRPGQPIGGIIVKGGKNPGGQMKNLVVDDQGNIRFEVLEAGNYKFIIQTPETTDGNNQNAREHVGDPHENLNGKHLKDLNNSERSKKLKSKHETAKNSISNVR